MSHVYVVNMWLTCTDNSAKAYTEFRKRFTPEIENAWACLVYDGSLTDLQLKQELDLEIQSQMQVWIENDLLVTITAVNTFVSGGWSEGGGGLHEGHAPVFGVPTSNHPPKALWKFAYPGGGGNKPDIYARAQWVHVGVHP